MDPAREELLDDLAALVSRLGAEAFSTPPIIWDAFPRGTLPNARGARALAERLLDGSGSPIPRSASDRCSDCGSLLPAPARVCPQCGGVISGRIAHRVQRLAAAEALKRRPKD